MSLTEPPDSRPTAELLTQLRAGDSEAAGEIYRRYHDELLLFVRARLGAKLRGALQSEDVLQSVALEAVQALPGFEPQGENSLRRFLHTLVLNKIRDRADSHGAQRRDGAVPLSEEMIDDLAVDDRDAPRYFDDEYERLERGLAALPETLREVIVLRRLEGLTSREVAERLGKSDAAVRKLYSRALARLAASMGPPQAGRDWKP